MIQRFAKSFSIALNVAITGFEQSYFYGETIDSILGYTDNLTGIGNRKAFARDRDRIPEGYSLIMIDIDNFKRINDTKGHLYGDWVLQRLAHILVDAAGCDKMVYRIAGDEFVVIIESLKAHAVCTEIRRKVIQKESFTISQGVVMNLHKGISNSALELADTALYESKAKGRDRITAAIPIMA